MNDLNECKNFVINRDTEKEYEIEQHQMWKQQNKNTTRCDINKKKKKTKQNTGINSTDIMKAINKSISIQ